jgi:oligopeptidase A
VLGGAELQGEAAQRFAAIQERQAELAQKFSENVLDATDGFSLPQAHRAPRAGVPADVLQQPAGRRAGGRRGRPQADAARCRATCR